MAVWNAKGVVPIAYPEGWDMLVALTQTIRRARTALKIGGGRPLQEVCVRCRPELFLRLARLWRDMLAGARADRIWFDELDGEIPGTTQWFVVDGSPDPIEIAIIPYPEDPGARAPKVKMPPEPPGVERYGPVTNVGWAVEGLTRLVREFGQDFPLTPAVCRAIEDMPGPVSGAWFLWMLVGQEAVDHYWRAIGPLDEPSPRSEPEGRAKILLETFTRFSVTACPTPGRRPRRTPEGLLVRPATPGRRGQRFSPRATRRVVRGDVSGHLGRMRNCHAGLRAPRGVVGLHFRGAESPGRLLVPGRGQHGRLAGPRASPPGYRTSSLEVNR